MTSPLKVEVLSAEKPFVVSLFLILFTMAYSTLFVWWAVASWYPELGLTYWQLVLPVYAARLLFGGGGVELKRTFKPASWFLPKTAKAAA